MVESKSNHFANQVAFSRMNNPEGQGRILMPFASKNRISTGFTRATGSTTP